MNTVYYKIPFPNVQSQCDTLQFHLLDKRVMNGTSGMKGMFSLLTRMLVVQEYS